MKLRLITVGLIVVVALSLLACSGVPKNITILADSSVGEEVEIAAGGSITVMLESNPTTGFKWELSGITDQTVLKQDGEAEYMPPEGTMVGAGGHEKWTFLALKKGTSTISLEYSRPWEGGEKAERTYTLNATVK
jgi:inhibitor of cysteine peptidase